MFSFSNKNNSIDVETTPIDKDHMLIKTTQNGITKKIIALIFSENEIEKIDEAKIRLQKRG